METSLKTNRLRIRLATDKEMEQLISIEKSKGMKLAYTQMLTASRTNPKLRQWYGIWIIELQNKSATWVGDLCFKGINDGIVEIGYGIKPEFWNNGYATEAVNAMKLWALNQPNVRIVGAETELDNPASIKVLKKNGFILNGILGEEGPRYHYIKNNS